MSFFSKATHIFREYASLILGAGLAGGVSLSMVPEILFLSRLRNMTHYEDRNGAERKIDPANQSIIDKVLLRISLKPEEEASLQFYISTLSDPVHYGSTKTRMGAVVGLPVSIQYNESLDLSTESFSFSGIPLSLNDTSNSDAAKELSESFAISNNAKAFMIAREVYYATSHRLHVEAVLRCFTGVGIIFSWHYFLKKLSFISNKLKPWAKFSCFSGVCLAWGSLYLVLHDTQRCWLDSAVDRRAAKLGIHVAEGGVEYYDSILKRNRALRLLTPSGKKSFTQFGNDVSTFRQKTLQKTTRKEKLVRLLESYKVKDATPDGSLTTQN